MVTIELATLYNQVQLHEMFSDHVYFDVMVLIAEAECFIRRMYQLRPTSQLRQRAIRQLQSLSEIHGISTHPACCCCSVAVSGARRN
jgi:hypothetical protein